MNQPKDYVDRSERVPEECDCIAAAIVFGAAGFVVGWLAMFLWQVV